MLLSLLDNLQVTSELRIETVSSKFWSKIRTRDRIYPGGRDDKNSRIRAVLSEIFLKEELRFESRKGNKNRRNSRKLHRDLRKGWKWTKKCARKKGEKYS